MATKSINVVIPQPVWEALEQYIETGPVGYETAASDGIDITIGSLIKYIMTAYGETLADNPNDLVIQNLWDTLEEERPTNRQKSIRTASAKLLDATASERTQFLISGIVNLMIPIPGVFDGYRLIKS